MSENETLLRAEKAARKIKRERKIAHLAQGGKLIGQLASTPDLPIITKKIIADLQAWYTGLAKPASRNTGVRELLLDMLKKYPNKPVLARDIFSATEGQTGSGMGKQAIRSTLRNWLHFQQKETPDTIDYFVYTPFNTETKAPASYTYIGAHAQKPTHENLMEFSRAGV